MRESRQEGGRELVSELVNREGTHTMEYRTVRLFDF
jgi:hypothetical protein